jgi:3-deoxy-D-manno-octulosonic-acid transferase
MAYFVYRYLSSLVIWISLPFLKMYFAVCRNHSEGFNQRLGLYPRQVLKKIPGKRIWVHAASVGEVGVAAVIVEEIHRRMPDTSIVVSTTTRTGQKIASAKLPDSVDLIYAPVDSVFAVRKALDQIQPDILVFVETEIWPNWIMEASARGVKILLINGRISVRSLKKYLKISPLIRPVLNAFHGFSMIHEEDAGRISAMGAHREKITVNGNAKYDGLIRSQRTFCLDHVLKTYSLDGDQTVFVAGSTRQKEELLILDAYEKILTEFPDAVLFIAPRHIERALDILRLTTGRGHVAHLRTRFAGNALKRTSQVVIMDTIGELAALYGAGTLTFCGGSLVPLGGQNLLEAAVWGRPVFYGPHMEDFQEARGIVESVVGEAFLVRNSDELARKSIYYLQHQGEREMAGKKVREAVLAHQGAAERHAELVCGAL